MKNIKGYIDHLRESEDDLSISYLDSTSAEIKAPEVPLALTGVVNVIKREAKRIIEERGLPGHGAWVFYPSSNSISFSTALEGLTDLDHHVLFNLFPSFRHGPSRHRDMMNVWFSSQPEWDQEHKEFFWRSSSLIPFSAVGIIEMITRMSGSPITDTKPNAEALVRIVMHTLDQVGRSMGIDADKLKRSKRSRGAFGRL